MTTSSNRFSISITPQQLERLSSASSARPLCVKCGLSSKCKTPFLSPWIPADWTGKILGIGEAPGADEDKSGRPFSGPSGKLLYRMLRSAGFRDRDLALVNAVRCRPRNNATPSMLQLRACRPFLLRVIEQLRPAAVVAFGGSAAKSLLDRGSASVTSLRGRPLRFTFETEEPQTLVVDVRVTYHPAAILRGATHLQKRVVQDLVRIRHQDRRDLEIVSSTLTDKVLSVDTEYDPSGELLTVSLSGRAQARVWDVEGDSGAA